MYRGSCRVQVPALSFDWTKGFFYVVCDWFWFYVTQLKTDLQWKTTAVYSCRCGTFLLMIHHEPLSVSANISLILYFVKLCFFSPSIATHLYEPRLLFRLRFPESNFPLKLQQNTTPTWTNTQDKRADRILRWRAAGNHSLAPKFPGDPAVYMLTAQHLWSVT